MVGGDGPLLGSRYGCSMAHRVSRLPLLPVLFLLPLLSTCSDDSSPSPGTATDGGLNVGGSNVDAGSTTGSFGRGFLFGARGNEGGHDVVVAKDGSVYVAGGYASGLVPDEPLSGGGDPFVARILPNGRVAWVRGIHSDSLDGALQLALHPDGGVIVTIGTGGGSVTTGGVAHLSESGAILWNQWLPPVTPLAVAVVGRRIFVAGYSHRTQPPNPFFGNPFPVQVQGSADGMLLELTADGTPVKGKLFSYGQNPESAHAHFTFANSISPIDEKYAFLTGSQQDNAQYGASGWVRLVDLDTFEIKWTRFFNKTTFDPTYQDKSSSVSEPFTWSSTTYAGCVTSAGELRVGWTAPYQDATLGVAMRAVVSNVDRNGNETRRNILAPVATAEDQDATIAIACDGLETAAVVGINAPVNLDTHFPGVLVRFDSAGNLVSKFRPEVGPIPPQQRGSFKVMALAYGPGGLFYTGEVTGSFEGYTSESTLSSIGTLYPDILVGRVDAQF